MNALHVAMQAVFADEDCLAATRYFVRRFSTDESCRRYLEAKLWPKGPVCPHCPGGKKVYRINGRSTRNGLHKCGACRKRFTVTVGTIFERSHIPLTTWFLGILFMLMWPNSMTVRGLQGVVGISYRSSWSMHHRILRAMRTGFLDHLFTVKKKEKTMYFTDPIR